MPKSKHSPEFRAKVSQEYLDGIGSKLATTSSTQHHKLKIRYYTFILSC